MPIIKSAKKRVRVARKATIRNSKTKRVLKTALKLFGSKATATTHASAQSALDKAGKRGVLHKNKVARKKSQLAKAAKAAGVKTAGTGKAATAKPADKKPTAKKSPAKKPTAKKLAAKKK